MNENVFILFGTPHIIAMIVGVISIFIFVLLGRIFNEDKIARFFAIIVGGIKISELVYRYYIDGEYIYQLLPLHLCNISIVVSIILMFKKSNFLFQLLYYWSVGSIFAIVTPELYIDFPNPVTFSFFITHFFIFASVVYCIFNFRFYPTMKGLVLAFITINIIAVLVYFINKNFGTNYLYINESPGFQSPLSYLGKWPLYIFNVEILYIIISLIVYFPFRNKNKNDEISTMKVKNKKITTF